MKKISLCLLITAVLGLNASIVYAIGDTATNLSAEYLRSGGIRNASLDVDASWYNPAGLPFMREDGLYLNLANQMLFTTRRVKDEETGIVYEGDVSAYLFPTLAVVFKSGSMAFYLHGGPYGGTSAAEYDNGLVSLAGFENMSVSALPVIMGFTLGGAYAPLDALSVAAGARVFFARSQIEIRDDVAAFETVASGTGFGVLFGVDVKPIEKLNIGFQFMWNSELEVENETTEASGLPEVIGSAFFADGAKSKVTLPMMVMLGVSYMLTPELKIEADGVVYLESLNDLGKVTDPFSPVNGDDVSSHYETGFEVGIGVEYDVVPDFLTISAGYMYGHNGQEKEVTSEFAYWLDYNQIGTGATVTPIEDLDLTVGYTFVLFNKGRKSYDNSQSFHDDPLHVVGLGLGYKLF